MTHGKERIPEVPQSFAALAVTFPLFGPQLTRMDPPFVGPSMAAPAGTDQMKLVAPGEPEAE